MLYKLFYDPTLDRNNVEFVELYSKQKRIEDVIEGDLKEKFLENRNKEQKFIRAFQSFSVLEKKDIERGYPAFFISDQETIQDQIIRIILEKYNKPKDYEHLVDLKDLIHSISQQPIKNSDKKVVYNIFGSITGRLTTEKGSFPVLTLSKEDRVQIEPNKDLFVEMDINSTDVRFFLFLCGKIEQEKDIHEKHRGLISEHNNKEYSRKEAKELFLSWLYGSQENIKETSFFQDFYDREKVLEEYFFNDRVITPFDRVIETEYYKALPLLVQSTASDSFLRQVVKIYQYMRKNQMKSKIAFLIHDSMVIDFVRAEKKHFHNIKNIFCETTFGKVPANIKIGTNFGQMKEVK